MTIDILSSYVLMQIQNVNSSQMSSSNILHTSWKAYTCPHISQFSFLKWLNLVLCGNSFGVQWVSRTSLQLHFNEAAPWIKNKKNIFQYMVLKGWMKLDQNELRYQWLLYLKLAYKKNFALSPRHQNKLFVTHSTNKWLETGETSQFSYGKKIDL